MITPTAAGASKKARTSSYKEAKSEEYDLTQLVQKTLTFSSGSFSFVFKQVGIGNLGRDLTAIVLSYLDPTTLDTCSELEELKPCIPNSFWQSFDLNFSFPHVYFFGIDEWHQTFPQLFPNQHIKNVVIDKHIVIHSLIQLDKLSSRFDAVDLECSVITIPEGFTLKNLWNAWIKMKGNNLYASNVLSSILEKYGEQSVAKTYTIVIANIKSKDKIDTTIDQKVQAQNELLKNNHIRLPTLLEALIYMMIIIETKIEIIKDENEMFMRCAETLNNLPLFVGGCTVRKSICITSNNDDFDFTGVGVVSDF